MQYRKFGTSSSGEESYEKALYESHIQVCSNLVGNTHAMTLLLFYEECPDD
ncbi:MAG: hypothetical protein KDD48_08455 [Bdellovibrionales bacterium]|nr:hypothetical protein [Bdellovibrionales bacterium]